MTILDLTIEDLARLDRWQFRSAWEALGEAVYLKARLAGQANGQVEGSDSSTSRDVPKSEPQIQPTHITPEQEVERLSEPDVPPSVGAPSVDFSVADEAAVPVRLSLQDATPVNGRRGDGIPADEAAPTHFYLCVPCGYEAAGPATLEAHKRTHVEVEPLPSRKTAGGLLSSNMTPEQEANWVAAMRRGETITDDGPSPVEDEPAAIVAARPAKDIPRSADAGDVCRWCSKQCGGVAGRKTHESYCEARPMAKRAEGEHIHHWRMESPNGPVIPGRCDCGATREDPASPTPIVKTADREPGTVGAYDRGPVPCDVCGTLVGRGAGMASHKRFSHKATNPIEAVKR